MTRTLRAGLRSLDLAAPAVMGIVNVTPDSFHADSRQRTVEGAVARALAMVEQGARLIDIGGESTRPGAQPTPVEVELARVLPVIERLRARTDALISVDTMKAPVMRAAVAAGADLVNDVAALSGEGAMAVASAVQAAVCLVHMQGTPATMQLAPHYDDAVAEVAAFLEQRLAACDAAGITRDRLLVDPGFGFGKRLADNLALMRRLDALASLGVPILVGVSRKGMIGEITGRAVGERLAGGLAFALHACQHGAAIIRTHDVAETVDVLKVFDALGRPAVASVPSRIIPS